MAITIQTTTYNVIYVISRDVHPGLLKIGKTSVATDDVEKLTPNCAEMNEATKQRYSDAATMGITDMHILYTEVAFFQNDEGKGFAFDDHVVHEVLEKSGYKRKPIATEMGTGEEWFEVDLDHAIKAIAAVKNEQSRIDGPKDKPLEHIEIKFRDEQTAAIEQTLHHFTEEKGEKMLWNAKMRFGKTLCALEVIRRLNLPRVMILTHRPTVRSGWFDDYHLIKFENTIYGSKNGKSGNRLNDKENDPEGYVEGKDLQTMEDELAAHNTRYIYFASMQDLRGKQKDKDGHKIWKGNNELVYSTQWDLIILDEAHEGTQTALGKEVLDDLCNGHGDHKPQLLYLSGTPYNILSLFDEKEIYTWDYTMEQEAKNSWESLHPGEKNPYEGLAQLHIYTYDLGDVYKENDYRKEDDKNDYFNFAEFFRTWSGEEEKDGRPMPAGAKVGQFVHEGDVKKFLDLLCCESPTSYYPFSNQQFRQALKHTLWMLPGVAEAKRMQELILAHKLHTLYGFEVENVAGEGESIDAAKDDFKKIEKQERDALLRVKAAVSNHDKTITLSCGRLTTGVSVPEWTGVLMLRGSYNTGAANYMQTIFRSQTPFKNGAIKTDCYAFDFAPDRTLTVVDEFAKNQPRSRNTPPGTGGGNERIESTLRHLPVVAMKGGREVEYDAIDFVKDVNRAYSDHVISHGFKSRHLFRDVNTFSDADHALLSGIGKLLGGGKVAQNNDGTIIVAKNDLTDEGKGTQSHTKKKGKNNVPPKPKKNPAKTEQNRQSQRVLDLILVRLPLLLFGAAEKAEKLTLEELLSDDFIDRESWEEFMPKKFTKATFGQIAHLLQIDVLAASTAKIIEQAREADALPIEERTRRMADIVAKFRFPDKETVLTPWRVVNMHMTDTLGGYDFYNEAHAAMLSAPRFVDRGSVTTEVLRPHDTRILEINSKSGVYPLWVAYNLWRLQRTEGMTPDAERRLWTDVLRRNLYVVCKTRMAEKITRRVLAGYDTDVHVNAVTLDNLVGRLKDEKECNKLVKKILSPLTYNNETEEMKKLQFNAVVGNPPYQVMDGGAGVSATPIYNRFVEVAKKISPLFISMIMPAKWYTDGKGLNEFRGTMFNDKSLIALFDYPNSRDCFNNVDIAGGICYFLWGKEKRSDNYLFTSVNNGKATSSERELSSTDNFLRFMEAEEIVNKIKNSGCDAFYDCKVSTRKPFGLKTNDIPTSKGDLVLKYNKGRGPYPSEKVLKGKELIDKYNVVISYLTAEHAGQTDAEGRKKILSSLDILKPKEVCTETYLVVDSFDTEEESRHCYDYLRTRFVRFLVSLLAATQHITKEKFSFVPLQDFTSKSDVNWSKSIEEIDQYLYKKYNLSQEDIDFIKKTIKPM